MNPLHHDLESVLFTEQQIQARLDAMAQEIQRDYTGKDLTMVAVLTGSVMFIADLLRRLTLPLHLDCIGACSYHGTDKSSGELTVTKTLRLDVRGRDVLIIDDILDTGLTMVRLREMVLSHKPRSLKCGVFLEKDVPHHNNLRADYVGFCIPNQFVVGYGLDYRERYRNLPCVGVLKPAIIAGS